MTFDVATVRTAWRRRWWRPDPSALATFAAQAPVVVITGASAGIGLALAHRFAALERDMLLIARNGNRLEAAALALRRTSKNRVVTLALDVTAPDVTAGLDTALAAMGGYADILVNSAGCGYAGLFARQSPSALDGLVALNVMALTRLCRHVLPGQLVRGRGGVINLASLGAYLPGPQQAAYYATKAYVLSLSEALATETAGQGVTITTIAPGPVNTGFHATMGAGNSYYRWLIPALGAEYVARAAIAGFRRGQRVVVPGLVANLLMVLARVLPHRVLAPVTAILLRPGPP